MSCNKLHLAALAKHKTHGDYNTWYVHSLQSHPHVLAANWVTDLNTSYLHHMAMMQILLPGSRLLLASLFLPVLIFTFSQMPTALSLLGSASSAWPSLLRLSRKCSNQLLSPVYSLMCLQLSTSVLGMRQVSWDLLLCRVRAASLLLARCGASTQHPLL